MEYQETLDKAKGVLSLKTDKPIPPAFQKLFEQNLKKWLPEIKKINFSAKAEAKKAKTEALDKEEKKS